MMDNNNNNQQGENSPENRDNQDANQYQPTENQNAENTDPYQPTENGNTQNNNPYNQQPTYQRSYNNYRQPNNQNGFAIASLTLGIAALILSCCCTYLSIPCGITGLVLGIISLRNSTVKNTMAIVGVITSSIGFLFAVIFILIVIAQYHFDYYDSLYYYIENMLDI